MLESIPPEEEQHTQSLIELLSAKMLREKKSDGEVERDAHPKQHGLVQATFSILDDIPEQLKIGLFKKAKKHDAWMRFSNQNAPVLPDNDKDIRGLALKLFNVHGQKLLAGHEKDTTQDFITISTDAFVTKNVKEFDGLIKAMVKGKIWMLLFLMFHWRVVKNLLKANRRFVSPLDINYFSCTPYLLGDVAVKYQIKPSPNQTVLKPHSTKPFGFLKDIMQQQLSSHAYQFDFSIQVQSDAKQMPVEDPGVAWDQSISPFVKVATIEIPKQDFSSEAQHRYGIELAFNPWRCLKEHRPLGGINRARKKVYESISSFRHDKNGTKKVEPTSMVSFEKPNEEKQAINS